METPHITEEYFCIHCHKPLGHSDVFRTWDCPICKNKIHIRIITEDKDNACYRFLPHELNVNDIILTHRDSEYYSILKIIDFNSNTFQFNLQKYGAWKISKDRYVLKIDGGWYH
ncbi:hypothetical protein [uncultured Chryseobacterium sp.]|uniref:hypothetical protein n=1 Tax=uncultured Chryseobacterium sp. TaxID=259322 RepID=UPI00374A5836